MPARILSMIEFRVRFGLGEKAARKMVQSGDILALKTPAGWRIPDPGPQIVELMRRQYAALAAVPLIRGVEASQLMQISDRRLRQLAEQGRIEFRNHGSRRLYSLDSITSYMSSRGRKRVQREGYIRPQVMNWAKRMLRQTLNEQGVVLPDFLRDEHSENSTKAAV